MNRRGALFVFAGVALLTAGHLFAPAGWPDAQRRTEPEVRMPEEQAVDLAISEMLAAWQLGDLALLEQYHAPEVTVVSGAFEPPILGWANYARAYQAQRQRVQQPHLLRRNTYVQVRGTLAWATYQWEFAGLLEGTTSAAQGHATLVLEKRRDRWVVLHNHTSVVAGGQTPQPAVPPAL